MNTDDNKSVNVWLTEELKKKTIFPRENESALFFIYLNAMKWKADLNC